MIGEFRVVVDSYEYHTKIKGSISEDLLQRSRVIRSLTQIRHILTSQITSLTPTPLLIRVSSSILLWNFVLMTGIAMGEDEIEYESDPEEAKLSLQMRRRVASDDEAEEGVESRGMPRRRDDDSDGESEGAVAEYEDECEEEEGEEVYDLDEEYAEAGYEESGGGRADDGANAVAVESVAPGTDGGAMGELMEEKLADDDAGEFRNENEDAKHEGEKKEMEPYAVPTAGAFYMHDDRFRDSAGGRNRYRHLVFSISFDPLSLSELKVSISVYVVCIRNSIVIHPEKNSDLEI